MRHYILEQSLNQLNNNKKDYTKHDCKVIIFILNSRINPLVRFPHFNYLLVLEKTCCRKLSPALSLGPMGVSVCVCRRGGGGEYI